MKMISMEEFDKLSLEEKKEEIIKLLRLVPDEEMPGLYDEVQKLYSEYEDQKSSDRTSMSPELFPYGEIEKLKKQD